MRGVRGNPYKNDGAACHTLLELKKRLFVPLRVFCLKWPFAVYFKVLSPQNMTGDNQLLVPLRGEKNSSHTH